MSLELLNNQKGSVMVLIAAASCVIFGAAALSVDAGVMYAARADLVNTADAAALAGAQNLNPSDPSSSTIASNTAQSFVETNIKGASAEITFPDNSSISVKIHKTVNMFFLPVLGRDTVEISASATAKVSPARKVNAGIIPFGVEEDFFKSASPGVKVDLMLRNPNSPDDSGNCYALALGGTGAANLKTNIVEGYGPLSIGDVIDTEPGVQKNKVIQGVEERIEKHGREVIVPIVTELGNGRNEVVILGFAAFLLLDPEEGNDDALVTGKFINFITVAGNPDDDTVPNGVYCIHLIR